MYPSRVCIIAGKYPSEVHILAPSIPNSICANFYSTLKLNIHSNHCIVLRLSSLRIQQQNMRQEFIDAQIVSVSSVKHSYPPYQQGRVNQTPHTSVSRRVPSSLSHIGLQSSCLGGFLKLVCAWSSTNPLPRLISKRDNRWSYSFFSKQTQEVAYCG